MRQTLGSIVGNSSLKTKLFSDISSGTLSHAYIIEGKKGSGRHTVAYMTAAALSCERLDNGLSPLPCLECPSCKKIIEKKSPDVILITREDKATIGVDPIRFLRNDVRVIPNELDYKIYIIEDADTMTHQAQNAFLLTLEEPPSYVKFFLLCEDSDKFLETIRSRAQIIRTETIDTQMIDDYLQDHSEAAKRLKLSDTKSYNELIMAADGSIGRALELLDEKTLKRILDARALARDFLVAITSKKNGERSASLLTRFDKKREVVLSQLMTIETALRDVIVIERTENAPLLFFYNSEEALEFADAINIRRLMDIYTALKKTEDAISQNANIRLSLTSLFLEINIV